MVKDSNGQILNIELKAKCRSVSDLETILQKLGGRLSGIDEQYDTYFNCPHGRLKLREGDIENSLLYYCRSDEKAARESNIVYEDTKLNKNLKNLLSKALGVKKVVHKKRKIYYLENIKIHFDNVPELGEFVEIEAIDDNGTIGRGKLQNQCDDLASKFSIKKKDIVKFSYSDLVDEGFFDQIIREAKEFYDLVIAEFAIKNIDISILKDADHLCYRASSYEEYKKLKANFMEVSNVIVESIIGNREIATFKFLTPIVGNITVLELAAPKHNNSYASGFEHLEIVINDSFEQMIERYADIKFDIRGINKSINPELRIIFDSGVSVKFHHNSLEATIHYEKTRFHR